MASPLSAELSGHVAIVTGANHGIGAATARALAARGAAVLISYLRIDDAPDPGTPQTYRANRAQSASAVVEAITSSGGRRVGMAAVRKVTGRSPNSGKRPELTEKRRPPSRSARPDCFNTFSIR